MANVFAPFGFDLHVTVYRAMDATELAYLQITGNFGSNPNRSGKYFALTLAGAIAFASAPMNAGSTIIETTLPQSVVSLGWTMIDPGPHGAGHSVYFEEAQLPVVYGAMTLPMIVAGAGPGP